MSEDVRAYNAQGHQTDSNDKVIGLHTLVCERPGTTWKCRSVRLMDEYESAGRTVIFNHFFGGQSAAVHLLTGFHGCNSEFDEMLPDTSGKGELIITAKFTPPSLGPLAVCVGDKDSDIVGNLGLPFGRHISVIVEWELRGQTVATATSTQVINPGIDLERLTLLTRVELLEANLAATIARVNAMEARR